MPKSGLLIYQGEQQKFPSDKGMILPPSKSQLIRRIFIGGMQGNLSHQMTFDSNWPQDVLDAWFLVTSFESRRQNGDHDSEELVWEAGEAGTVMRFGLAFLVAHGCGGILQGRGRAHERPVGELVSALLSCGARIEYLAKSGFPPLRIRPSHLVKKDVFLQADQSSQYISAMVLVAPLLQDAKPSKKAEPWTISWPSEQIASGPYLELTVHEMRTAGYSLVWSGNSIAYHAFVQNSSAQDSNSSSFGSNLPSNQSAFHSSGPKDALSHSSTNVDSQFLEGDWSAASFWIWRQCALPLCRKLKLQYLKEDSLHPDKVILDLLPGLSPSTTWGFESSDGHFFVVCDEGARDRLVDGLPKLPGRAVPAIFKGGIWSIRATDFPDMVPALVMWSVLSGISLDLWGIGHLQFKESDRIKALSSNLQSLGIPHEQLGVDGLAVRPRTSWQLHSRQFTRSLIQPHCAQHALPLLKCFGDHRIAMALSMLVLPDLPIPLDDPHVVRKSYPGFWDAWAEFGVVLQPLN